MNAKELLESNDVKSDIERFKKSYIGYNEDPVMHETSVYTASVALLREYLDRKDPTLNSNYAEVLVSGIFPESFVLGICKMVCTHPFAKSLVMDPRILSLICT